jgi:prolyl oligopeptidase
VLDNVASRLEEWSTGARGWQRREVKAPYPGKLSVRRCTTPNCVTTLAEAYFLNAADFLQPDSLQLGAPAATAASGSSPARLL